MSYKDPKGLLEEIKLLVKTKPKSQSAMEYLMTYGWSILIIAVVLGALSFLGIFNSTTFTPKASPGNCQAIKNSGLGVSNLEGACNNQIPEYVAGFNGGSSQIEISNTRVLPGGSSNRTVTAWAQINTTSSPSADYILFYGNFNTENGIGIWIGNACGNSNYSVVFDTIGCTTTSATTVQSKTWFFVAAEYNGSTKTIYTGYDGKMQIANTVISEDTTSGDPLYISSPVGGLFQGYISNVQIYNMSLSSSSINALYQEGIGGVPIDPQNLVGWWPLNGNANDYSGNQNDGISTNVIFTSNWYGGYTQP